VVMEPGTTTQELVETSKSNDKNKEEGVGEI
jgi:hypothetical protein